MASGAHVTGMEKKELDKLIESARSGDKNSIYRVSIAVVSPSCTVCVKCFYFETCTMCIVHPMDMGNGHVTNNHKHVLCLSLLGIRHW